MKQVFHAYNKAGLIAGFRCAIPDRGFFEELQTDVVLHLISGKEIVYNLICHAESKEHFEKHIKKVITQTNKISNADLIWDKRKRERTK